MSTVLLVLILLMAFLVVRILIRIIQQYRCPDEALLRDFFYGRLRPHSDEKRDIVAHLGHCRRCRNRLDDIREGKGLEDHMVE